MIFSVITILLGLILLLFPDKLFDTAINYFLVRFGAHIEDKSEFKKIDRLYVEKARQIGQYFMAGGAVILLTQVLLRFLLVR